MRRSGTARQPRARAAGADSFVVVGEADALDDHGPAPAIPHADEEPRAEHLAGLPAAHFQVDAMLDCHASAVGVILAPSSDADPRVPVVADQSRLRREA
jgi:hypothetical protein